MQTHLLVRVNQPVITSRIGSIHKQSRQQLSLSGTAFISTIHPIGIFNMKTLLIIVVSLLLYSCTKTNVEFISDSETADPSVTYYDNYPLNLFTYKIDSFSTSAHSCITAGFHRDDWFGHTEAASYTELLLPDENTLKGQSAIYDSLVLLLRPNKYYYGDTILPLRMLVNELTENISNDNDNTLYYNARTFNYNPVPLGTRTVTIRPNRDSLVTIRLSDVLGQDLFQKLKTNNSQVQSQSEFIKYLKGIRIGVDSSNSNTLYYFNMPSDSVVLKLYYRLNGTTYQEKQIGFKINTAKQYNYINTDRGSSPLALFTDFKKQLKASSLTQHKAYLHSNVGSMIKIGIPNLLTLKELHPYVKIIKAELIIRPAPGTYFYPYALPSTLYLYSTDDGNGLISQLLDATGQSAQTGDLAVDVLYGENTYYSFDITSFISAVISEGQFSKSALMLVSSSGTTETNLQRLVINDQTLAKGIQLKLHVLGL